MIKFNASTSKTLLKVVKAKVYINTKWPDMCITTRPGARLFDSFVWHINVTYRA